MRSALRKLDDFIRKVNGVFEFTQDEQCLLRLQVSRTPHPLTLPDLNLNAGEPVIMLHLWNERLSQLPSDETSLAWARQFMHRFKVSIHLVASYLCDNPQLGEIKAIGGVTILLNTGYHEGGERVVQRLGFTVFPYSHKLGRFGEFWENFFSWLLIWTFNPAHLPGRSLLRLRRPEVWMSREDLLGLYGNRE